MLLFQSKCTNAGPLSMNTPKVIYAASGKANGSVEWLASGNTLLWHLKRRYLLLKSSMYKNKLSNFLWAVEQSSTENFINHTEADLGMFLFLKENLFGFSIIWVINVCNLPIWNIDHVYGHDSNMLVALNGIIRYSLKIFLIISIHYFYISWNLVAIVSITFRATFFVKLIRLK